MAVNDDSVQNKKFAANIIPTTHKFKRRPIPSPPQLPANGRATSRLTQPANARVMLANTIMISSCVSSIGAGPRITKPSPTTHKSPRSVPPAAWAM